MSGIRRRFASKKYGNQKLKPDKFDVHTYIRLQSCVCQVIRDLTYRELENGLEPDEKIFINPPQKNYKIHS